MLFALPFIIENLPGVRILTFSLHCRDSENVFASHFSLAIPVGLGGGGMVTND